MEEKFEQLKSCLYCHSSDLLHVLSAPDRFGGGEELFSIVRCSKCGLVFQNPRVKEGHIGSYYGDSLHYYQVPVKKNKTILGRLKHFIEVQTLIEYFNYSHLGSRKPWLHPFLFPFRRWQCVQLTPRFVSGGTVLDIGCSHGAYLARMRSLGWNVVGQEMHGKSAQHAINLDIPVTIGRIEDAKFAPGTFDVVTMNMVLEHVYDPFAVLQQATGWLKPGGMLMFAIPYFNGFEFSVFKEYSYGLQLPCHITFLNKDIIRKYLKAIGYDTTKFYFHFFDRDIAASAQFRYKDKGGRLDEILGNNKAVRRFLIKPFVWILSLFDKTSRVTVRATKLI